MATLAIFTALLLVWLPNCVPSAIIALLRLLANRLLLGSSPPELSLHDRGGLLHLMGQAFGDESALVEHDDSIAQPHDQTKVVVDDQHADAVLGTDLPDA